MQSQALYNNSLQELQDAFATQKEMVDKDTAFRDKLKLENKPYAYMDIRINKTTYLLDCIEAFVQNSYNLVTELQEENNKKNNAKLVQHYTDEPYRERNIIGILPTKIDYEMHEKIDDLHDKIDKLIKAQTH